MAEVTALLAGDGRGGGAQLHEASLGEGALLLEQLDSGRSLSGLGLFDAAEISRRFDRQLGAAAPGLCQRGDMATEIAETVEPPAQRPGQRCTAGSA